MMYYQHSKELYCSFCQRPQSQVKRLVARGGVYICNECVSQFRSLLKQNSNQNHSACACSHDSSHEIGED